MEEVRNPAHNQIGSYSPIVNIVKLVSSFSTMTLNNEKDDRIIYSVKRADGGESMLDNKFLNFAYPNLVNYTSLQFDGLSVGHLQIIQSGKLSKVLHAGRLQTSLHMLRLRVYIQ